MPPKPASLRTLLDLTSTTLALLTHFQSSLSPTATADASIPPPPNPLQALKACTSLLKSHTTTLSLLLLTPPLTPSAIITKIGDVSSGPLTGLVGAAVAEGELGDLMQAEVKVQVRRLLGAWGEVVGCVVRLAERRKKLEDEGGAAQAKKDDGPTEGERQAVLAATGVVWEACDALVKLCDGGIAGLVVRKAEEWRSVLLDAVEELKEWGDDVDDDDAEEGGSDGEFGDEDEMFGAANKLGKEDKELKEVLDKSVKKLKMVGVLYQALIKRRLKTFPSISPATAASAKGHKNPMTTLEELMKLIKSMPEQVDDLASAFYDLDADEAKTMLDKCCGEAKSAATLVKQNWSGNDDEFTAWSTKWVDALNAP
ncbi:uncharacterized protein CC84DRAFT_1087329 [Paraphaeosphaeria sporulosa]|uniref:Cyclin-D1-binding protein 1-like N-terminal domain-containing protein n=1 Tax=Paraphaeosphaeria sporulosa TaxID=1460663 RepID=A0A177CLY5_9PLEO|nr:uncharacterized protein CC84DRAFT_1087329 [Paraphaeosphaeria sporulosa]OAG07952.1 hypothetical protein CC84DRAFT_1087329 [Paraphaeosphaeria sporulosa]